MSKSTHVYEKAPDPKQRKFTPHKYLDQNSIETFPPFPKLKDLDGDRNVNLESKTLYSLLT